MNTNEAIALHREALAAWDNQSPNWSPAVYFEKVRVMLNAQQDMPLSPAWCDSIDAELDTPNGTWVPLTDEDRERAFNSLPDMLDGFLKKWGWLHFANAIEEICREKNCSLEQKA